MATQNYVSPKERVITAKNAEFLSTMQNVGESDDNISARLREKAGYCDFKAPKTAANPKAELVKIKFISGLRDPEAKFRLLDGNKAKLRLLK